MTVVALNQTATYVATATGTYTPFPYDVVTPTPFPTNLETVQAVALAQGAPAVVPHTPVPQNNATATFVAAIATAVAQTTGTYTPIPTGYVTPILIYPSPPAENIVTAVARETAAAAAALRETPTPVPFNAVFGYYAIATVTPENVMTAAVLVAEATTYAEQHGTPEPTPWNRIIITPTPLPVEPTPTPTKVVEVLSLTPTPTPTSALVTMASLDEVMASLRGQILFKTNRNFTDEIFALNPATYQLSRITDPRVYPLAREQLTRSPDGRSVAIVEIDDNQIRQIKVLTEGSSERRRITTFPPKARGATQISYDPAWSPTSNLIAFVTNNTGNDEIFTIDSNGEVLKQLTFNTTEWDKHPTWSPDGSQIVFFSNRNIQLRRLWIMNADGSNQRDLSSLAQPGAANPDYEDWDPVWLR
jgi:hypothetical protein